MATTHTLSGNIFKLARAPFGAKDLSVSVVTNLPHRGALVDKTTNGIYLGGFPADVNSSTGDFTSELIDTSATDLNVAANTLEYEVRAVYVDPATGIRSTWTSGWFPFTADANLADIVTDVEPIAVQSASSFAQDAADSAALARSISEIDTTDAAIKTSLELPGSQSGEYLSATFVAAVVMVGTGIDPTGATDSTTALQAKIDGAASFGVKRIHFPDGVFKHDGTLAISAGDTEVTFSGGAWLQPTAGSGLTVTGSRAILHRPRVRVDGGTPTAGIKVSGAGAARTTINDPVVWAFSNVPANFDPIVFDDNCYWGRVSNPKVRKDSGALTGTFRRAVAFTNLANAGSVWGGDLVNADVGVYVEDSNHCKIIGTDFEGVTIGVEGAGSGQGPGGLRVLGTRHEAGTTCVKLSSTATSINAPVVIELGRVSSVATLVDDVNGLGYILRSGAREVVRPGKALGDGLNARRELTVGDAQTESPWVLLGRAAFGRMVEWDKNGNLILKSDSASSPTPGEQTGCLRHYNGTTYLGSVHPTSTAGTVMLHVGDGAGGRRDVLRVNGSSVAPATDAFFALGGSANRWTNAHFSQYVRVGQYPTGSRPAAATVGAGAHIFDVTIGKPIWSNGTNWVDATGATV